VCILDGASLVTVVDLRGSTCGSCTGHQAASIGGLCSLPEHCRLGPGPRRPPDGAGQWHHREGGRLGCQRRIGGRLPPGRIHLRGCDAAIIVDRHRHQGWPLALWCHHLLLLLLLWGLRVSLVTEQGGGQSTL
jgi:hypothetical protein